MILYPVGKMLSSSFKSFLLHQPPKTKQVYQCIHHVFDINPSQRKLMESFFLVFLGVNSSTKISRWQVEFFDEDEGETMYLGMMSSQMIV